MPFYSDGYKLLREEFDIHLNSILGGSFQTYDKYSHSVEWLFSIADFLYHAEVEVPQDWHFSHEPGYGCTIRYSVFNWTHILVDFHLEEGVKIKDIILFGNSLNRYIHILRRAVDY